MTLARVVGVWLVLVVAMSANGAFREVMLRPRLGDPVADTLSAVLGIAIIVTITWRMFRPLAGASTAHLTTVSVLLVALTLAFELLFGHYVDRKSWSELLENYALWRGRLWPIVLATLAAMPFVWGRWRHPGSASALR